MKSARITCCVCISDGGWIVSLECSIGMIGWMLVLLWKWCGLMLRCGRICSRMANKRTKTLPGIADGCIIAIRGHDYIDGEENIRY